MRSGLMLAAFDKLPLQSTLCSWLFAAGPSWNDTLSLMLAIK
jgi:hypothetical protein